MPPLESDLVNQLLSPGGPGGRAPVGCVPIENKVMSSTRCSSLSYLGFCCTYVVLAGILCCWYSWWTNSGHPTPPTLTSLSSLLLLLCSVCEKNSCANCVLELGLECPAARSAPGARAAPSSGASRFCQAGGRGLLADSCNRRPKLTNGDPFVLFSGSRSVAAQPLGSLDEAPLRD